MSIFGKPELEEEPKESLTDVLNAFLEKLPKQEGKPSLNKLKIELSEQKAKPIEKEVEKEVKEVEVRTCLDCGRKLSGKNKRKIYCSKRCKDNRRYILKKEKIKKTSREYYLNNKKRCLDRSKKYFKEKWLPKNRAKFNEMMRMPNLLRWRRI